MSATESQIYKAQRTWSRINAKELHLGMSHSNYRKLDIKKSWKKPVGVGGSLLTEEQRLELHPTAQKLCEQEKGVKYRHTPILLHFADTFCFVFGVFFCLFFKQIEGLCQPRVEQVYRHHFPAAFAHFVSLDVTFC